MVSFDNIVVNQRVEVRMRGGIYTGTVKYKGPINGAPGDWVGVNLDLAVGQHDGMINGRRYFACMEKHGIFTIGHHIRFLRTRRSVFNRYRTVKDTCDMEDELFDTVVPEPRNGPYDPIAADRPYSSLARAGSLEDEYNAYAPTGMKCLRSSISGFKPPATLKRATSAKSRLYDYPSTPMYYQYEHEYDSFVSRPTIPKTHMPRDALQQQVKRGWDNPHTHLVRDWSVHTGRESLRKSLWNAY